VTVLRRGAPLDVHPALDGVFTKDGSVVRFHPVRRLTRENAAALIARRVARLLERRGVAGSAEGEAPDLWSEEAPILAVVAAASVEGRVALGPRAAARVRRCGDTPDEVTPHALTSLALGY
jgi:hypothetical protein